MSTSRKIICAVSGKTYTFAKEYFEKKVEEYGDVDTLKRNFIIRRVKTYLNKGYSVQEIRNIMTVEDSTLPSADSQEMKDLIEFHKIRNAGKGKKKASSLNFATLKSDPDVSAFINTLYKYE